MWFGGTGYESIRSIFFVDIEETVDRDEINHMPVFSKFVVHRLNQYNPAYSSSPSFSAIVVMSSFASTS